MSKLIIEDEQGNIKVVQLASEPLTIGRKENNKIHLPDRNVSRYHAKIFRDNGKLFIEDVQSRYGIKLNGSKMEKKTALTSNDLVRIGDYCIRYVERDDAAVDSGEPGRKTTERLTPDIAQIESVSTAKTKTVDAFEGIDFEEEEKKKAPAASRKPLFIGISVVVAAAVAGALFYFSGGGREEGASQESVVFEEKKPVQKPQVIEAPAVKIEEKPAVVVKEETKVKEVAVEEIKKVEQPVKEEKPKKEIEKKETPAVKTKQAEEKKEKVQVAAVEKEKVEKEKSPQKQEAQVPKKGGVQELYKEGREAKLNGSIDLAIKLFKQCLSIEPSHADAAKQLGNIYNQVGNKSEAIKDFKKYLDIRPNAADSEAVRNVIKQLGGTP
ncbi:MAG: FHA domain-containing protein [Deltaproteobacteria bacterium]|nr:FHA domain-containing protein [Deltaproteobacteria bacterium]